MSRNLQIIDPQLGISANVKYEPLNAGDKEKAKVIYKTDSGQIVTMTNVDDQNKPVTYRKAYLDPTGVEHPKEQLKAHDESGDLLVQFEMTSVFEIIKYEPARNYVDRYIVDKYYEVYPSDDGKKKDADRKLASDLNRQQMKRLYDHLIENGLVAKAEFIASSGHYRAGAGYIRPITFDDGKWTLELGSFKEEKVFQHLHELHIAPVAVSVKANKPKNALI
ncbi:MAG: hypothetical protein UX36_C0006G0013 [Microgenomates group bacterium GW2011_GWC1_46_15]|nr:MAG: hypothetical protein UX36_C0006G0013 [Microgenomates group bacterium GW2011_GWC1_46_15]